MSKLVPIRPITAARSAVDDFAVMADPKARTVAARKAIESAGNSFVTAFLGDTFGGPSDEPNSGAVKPKERKLPTNLLQFPRSFESNNGRPDPAHFMIFKILDFHGGEVIEGAKSIALKGKKKRTKTQISLYMPASVDVAYKSQYQDLAVGAAAEGTGAIVDALKNVAGVYARGEMIDTALNQLPKVGEAAMAGGAEIANQLAISGAAKLVSNLPGFANVDKVIQAKAGKVMTDKMEFFFQGVGRRTFQYSFTFLPTSPEESKEVNKIITAFKLAMLPKYTTGILVGGKSDRTLTIPDMFDIDYMYLDDAGSAKPNRYLNKISTCYLTDMQIKYGSDRYTAYRPDDYGAPPQNTNVTLQFTEVEIITKETASKGY